jgi:hypothetical protein
MNIPYHGDNLKILRDYIAESSVNNLPPRNLLFNQPRRTPMRNAILLIIVILFPLGVCAQSTARAEADSRSAFEIILAKVRGAQAHMLELEMGYRPKPDPERVQRAQKALDLANSIKTRRLLIAFLLEPPDYGSTYEEPLRLEWVQILQNEQITAALELRRPSPTARTVIMH